MNRDDVLLLLMAVFLLLAMLLTICTGGNRSRHGYTVLLIPSAAPQGSAIVHRGEMATPGKETPPRG